MNTRGVRFWPALAAALFAGGALAWHLAPGGGLVGRYYSATDWTGTPVATSIEQPRADNLLARARTLFQREAFSAAWQGFFLVEQRGDYTFAVASDGGASLFLDGRAIVDSGNVDDDADDVGETVDEDREQTVLVEPGLHPIELRYTGSGRNLSVTVEFDGEESAGLPASHLFPSTSGYYVRRIGFGYVLPLLVALALLAVPLRWGVDHVSAHMREYPDERLTNRALAAVLGLTVVLALPGVGWGIPHSLSWAADELLVSDVAEGLRQGFSDGWHGAYPPFHYYVLGLLMLPFDVAQHGGLATVLQEPVSSTLTVLFRLVSVLMAAATAYLIYRVSLEVYGDRVAAIFSALMAASMPLFVYYAGFANLDMPYVFWLTLALFFYLRFVSRPRGADLVGFAVAATLSVCTKDQAYGYFVLPAIYAMWLRVRAYPSPRVAAFLRDRGLAAAAGGACLAFVAGQNLILNFDGFLSHLAYLTDRSTYAPAYAATLRGYTRMFADGLSQLSWSMGWPALVAGIAGFALTARRHPRAAVALALFVLSYYVFFLAIIRYQFDRFFLGVCVVLGITGGRALAALVRQTSRTTLWRAACAGVLTAGILYGALIPVMLTADSRYGVEAWLAAHVPRDELIAYVGRRTYLPRLRHGSIRVLESWSQVDRRRPNVLVVNHNYRCRARPGTMQDRFYDRLENPSNGLYKLVLSHRPDPWWPIDGPDDVFRARCENEETNLSRINPEIRVYRLVASS